MLIFESQRNARGATRGLLLAFAITVVALVVLVNGALAVAWGLTWGFWVAGGLMLPRHFLAVNTALVLLFVLGGWWVETSRLSDGGGLRLAEQLGARRAQPSGNLDEQRFVNTVHEMAIASGLPCPQAMVVARDARINAFAAGWSADDSVVAVTQGALDHLTREELQGLVAHEFSHIVEGDTRLNMRLIGMVFGLEMLYRLGQTLAQPDERDRRLAAALLGFGLMAAGWLGWLAGHALQAAVSRQREYLADARAVQWTRSRDGLGGVLRKAMSQRNATRTAPLLGPQVQHMLLISEHEDRVADWLDSHPTLEQRVQRIYGRALGPLSLVREDEARPSAEPRPEIGANHPGPDWTLV